MVLIDGGTLVWEIRGGFVLGTVWMCLDFFSL